MWDSCLEEFPEGYEAVLEVGVVICDGELSVANFLYLM